VDALDRFALYEVAVQDPARLVPFLCALHGGRARVLAEDFCGSAANSRAWCASVARGSAVAMDMDPQALARARGPGIVALRADLARWRPPPEHPRADVLYAGNYSIGYLGERGTLLEYLRGARARLAAGGLIALDSYGGAAAWRTGAVVRDHALADGLRLRATWEQRRVDPLSARVLNALSLRVDRDGEVQADLPDAFVYDWRLWTPAELAEALCEAGFDAPAAYAQLGRDGAAPRPVRDPGELGPADGRWSVCLAARAPGS
jgi:hypothetical protein